MKRHIVVAGNIGAGKSTLVGILSERLGFQPYHEPVTENPYLELFYADMERWAFHSQLFFLTYRVRSHHELGNDPRSVVQDRSVYEDGAIFARNLVESGKLSRREWTLYKDLYDVVVDLLPAPDLVVYIRATVNTLKRRIARRGREFEAGIEDAYLDRLGGFYEEWIQGFEAAPVLVIPGDEVDFVDSPEALEPIVNEIRTILQGPQGLLFQP